MEKTHRLILPGLLLFLFSACAQKYLNYEFVLERKGDLIFSNVENPKPIKSLDEETKQGVFALNIKNVGSKDVSFVEGRTSLVLSQEDKVPVTCLRELDKTAEFVMSPGAADRVECKIIFDKKVRSKLAFKDTAAELVIPYVAAGKEEQLNFKLYFRAEDYQ